MKKVEKLEKGITRDLVKEKYIVDTTYKRIRIKGRFDLYFSAHNYLKSQKMKIDLQIQENEEIIKNGITLQKAFDEMLENQKEGNIEIPESNYYKLNNKTVKLYKSVFENHLKGLAKEKLKSIDASMIKKELNKIQYKTIDTNGNIKYSDLPNRSKTILTRIFDYALDSNYISSSPRFANIKFSKPKNEIKTQNYISISDFELFCKTIEQMPEKESSRINNKDFIFLLKIYYYTGIRSGEGRGLKVEDFFADDLGEKKKYKVYIKRQMDDDSRTQTSFLKGGHTTRTVLLSKENYDYFLSFFKQKKYKKENFVFDFALDGNIIRRQKIERKLKKAVEFAKEREPKLKKLSLSSLQGFRISNGYYLKSLGIEEEERAMIQGHSVTVQQKYYAYSNEDKINEILNKKKSA